MSRDHKPEYVSAKVIAGSAMWPPVGSTGIQTAKRMRSIGPLQGVGRAAVNAPKALQNWSANPPGRAAALSPMMRLNEIASVSETMASWNVLRNRSQRIGAIG